MPCAIAAAWLSAVCAALPGFPVQPSRILRSVARIGGFALELVAAVAGLGSDQHGLHDLPGFIATLDGQVGEIQRGILAGGFLQCTQGGTQYFDELFARKFIGFAKANHQYAIRHDVGNMMQHQDTADLAIHVAAGNEVA